MTTAQNLATIDLLRVRAFPAQRGRAEVGSGAGITCIAGPGYHLAFLRPGQDLPADEGIPGVEAADQSEAECEALAALLDTRWGASQMFSLWSLAVRMSEGEGVAEPWKELCSTTPYLHLWRVAERWIALGVARWEGEPSYRLLVAITENDPP
ncbi:hypothetical protein AB0436_12875 [Streptomyces sp. NPDC051322]|uniref:hypothetical protein n=1 Tax=Streptomyces sp. NPDC051322 TaxID=3154645 RepID=UPI0034510394